MPPTQTLFSFDFSEPFNCQKLFPFNSFLNIPQKIVYSDRRGSTPVSTVLRKQVRFFIINILLIIITIRIIRIRIRIRINLRRRRRGGIMIIIIIIIIILIIIIIMINLSKLTGWKMVWTNVCLFVCFVFFFFNFRALDTSNESQTHKRGLQGEHPKISLGSMSPDPLEACAFLPRLGNRLVFILDKCLSGNVLSGQFSKSRFFAHTSAR